MFPFEKISNKIFYSITALTFYIHRFMDHVGILNDWKTLNCQCIILENFTVESFHVPKLHYSIKDLGFQQIILK